jgi:predicted NAD/FAD-dependent oxidoreductase
MSDPSIYIIGSGPASISCAQALVGDGYPVVILDGGWRDCAYPCT